MVVRGTARGELTVSSARLQAVEEIFHAALERRTAARSTHSCANDARATSPCAGRSRRCWPRIEQSGDFIEAPIATLDERLFARARSPTG